METGIIFPQIIERGCGMDVHRDTVVATIMGKDIDQQTVTFSTFTNSLKELGVWLKQYGVTHIAMESTGVYWKPVFNILDGDFQILLVNANHIKNIPGHKTDKKDSVWIAKLLLSGLLKASFIPPRIIRDLRDLCRYRKKLVQQATSERNRFERILQDANFKLSKVLSDIFGKTGTKIIDALLEDRNCFEEILPLCHGRIKSKRDELEQALSGSLTEHHKFMLRAIRLSIHEIENRIVDVEIEMDSLSTPFKNHLEHLQTIPGVNRISSTKILAEIGAEMDKFSTVNHLASWAGMCPGNNESAGKTKSSRATKGNAYLRTILVECAWSSTRVKNCYLRKKFESLIARKGKKRALFALGHKILIASYYIIKNNVEYQDLGYEYLDDRKKNKQIQTYVDRLKSLGVELQINSIT